MDVKKKKEGEKGKLPLLRIAQRANIVTLRRLLITLMLCGHYVALDSQMASCNCDVTV